MARIVWDAEGERKFETGLDHGVLYVDGLSGVPWNGLVSVSERSSGVGSTPVYMDGVKYYESTVEGEFAATIEAFTYPDEFDPCQGMDYDDHGLGYDQQARRPFGLTYRTMVGNDSLSLEYGYKIHVVYNALATPSDRANETMGDSLDPMTFAWDITTIPIAITGRRPTAHFVVDSRKVKSDTLQAFEDVIYGTASRAPQLISAQELVTMFQDWAGFEIYKNEVSGISPLVAKSPINDLEGNTNDGLFTESDDSRLTTTSVAGLYRLG